MICAIYLVYNHAEQRSRRIGRNGAGVAAAVAKRSRINPGQETVPLSLGIKAQPAQVILCSTELKGQPTHASLSMRVSERRPCNSRPPTHEALFASHSRFRTHTPLPITLDGVHLFFALRSHVPQPTYILPSLP